MRAKPHPGLAGALIAAACLSSAIATGTAAAAVATPTLTALRCWPSGGCQTSARVPVGGHLLITGRNLPRAPLVKFVGVAPVKGRLLHSGRILVAVPGHARTGMVRVRATGGRWSNTKGPITPIAAPSGATIPTPTRTAFDGNGMWIWELSKTENGNLRKIIAKARQHDLTTLFIKSGDGGGAHRNWAQFSTPMIQTLHAAGLQVCAWPYVYGKYPREEALASVKAIRLGADCLAIDAETEYEGRYSSASIYISTVRRAVGPGFPISLASYPYADYHPSFPYSVFFGPGGAQYNQPQAYWRDIGSSVGRVLSHTWMSNLPYGKPIFPIGQLYQSPRSTEINEFRSLAAGWGSAGVSWWDWQETPARLWNSVGSRLGWPNIEAPRPEWISLAKGAKGDLVVWAQQRLAAAGARIAADGGLGNLTRAAVISFQRSKGLRRTGVIDTKTWRRLLAVKMPYPSWARASAAAKSGGTNPITPASASLKGRREFRSNYRRSGLGGG